MAIAFDAATNGGIVNPGTSLSWSHTCTGVDRLLLVGIISDVATDAISGVTYNGVAMTKLITAPSDGAGFPRYEYLFGLLAPATGANTVLVSASGSVLIAALSSSYTGVLQSGLPDSSNTNSNASASSLTVSTTVVASGCWLAAYLRAAPGPAIAGTGTTDRVDDASTQLFGDSNGTVGTGSQSLQVTQSSAGAINGLIVSIAPSSGASGTRFYLPSTGSPTVSPIFGSGWDVTAAVRLMTSSVKQGTISAAVAFKGSGSNPNFSLGAQFVSVPLAAQTISGTVKGQMVTLDHAGQVTTLAVAIRLVDSTGADYGTVKHLVGPTPAASVSGSTPPVWPSVNNTNRQLLDSSDNPAIALTSRTAAAGDLLVIEIGGRVADTDSTFNRSPTAGDGSGSDLPEDNTTLTFFNPWVEFSQALTFLRSLPQIGLFDPDLRPEAWFDPGVAR